MEARLPVLGIHRSQDRFRRRADDRRDGVPDPRPALRGRLIGITRDPAAADDLHLRVTAARRQRSTRGARPCDTGVWLLPGQTGTLRSAALAATPWRPRECPGCWTGVRGLARRRGPRRTASATRSSPDALATLDGDDRRIVVLAAQGYRAEKMAPNNWLLAALRPALRLCGARGRLRSPARPGRRDRVTLRTQAGPSEDRDAGDDGAGRGRRSRQGVHGRNSKALGRLVDAYARAATGESWAVVVAGEARWARPGSSTPSATSVAADGGRVVTGGCLPLGPGGLPYGPFVEALRSPVPRHRPGALRHAPAEGGPRPCPRSGRPADAERPQR